MKRISKIKKLRIRMGEGKPLCVEQAATLVKLILRTSSMLATAIMLPLVLLVIDSMLGSALDHGALKNVAMVDLRPQINTCCIAISVVCMLYSLWSLWRVVPLTRRPIVLRDKAAEQFGDFFTVKEASGPTCLFSIVAIGVGVAFALAAPDLLISEFILPATAFEILTFGVGIRALISFYLRRLLLRRIRLTVVGGSEELEQRPRKRWSTVLWVLYWIVVIAAYLTGSYIFGSFLLYLYIPLIALLLFALFHTVNRCFYKKTGGVRLMLILRNVLTCGAIVLVCYLVLLSGTCINSIYIYSRDYGNLHQPNCDVAYDEATGVYTLTGRMTSDGGELRILQLTDIHYGGSVTTIFPDRKALDACYAMIEEAQPDLIVITGDIAYPIPAQSFTLNNSNPFQQILDFMNRTGIPWTIVYGNHDTEPTATWTGEQISDYYASNAGADSKLLYAKQQPDIYGRYNQYIRIQNQDGSLNRILFLLDTNDYTTGADGTKVYDSMHPDQVAWYENTIRTISAAEGKTVPSFVFMHIPMPAFTEAWEALKTGSEDAEYLFGENAEAVSCSASDNGMFACMMREKSTQAVFVGHDHVNNMGIRYKGIDLIYSKSIDYIAYPGIAKQTEQRGATLIHVYYDGYRVEQLDYAQ